VGPEPNPPLWPRSVVVLDPGDSAAGQTAAHLATQMSYNGADRYVILLRSGVYDADVPLGAFAQALGLGVSPENVTFRVRHGAAGIRAAPGGGGAPRSLENLRVDGDLRWDVARASSLRRVDVAGDVHGAGFAANTRIWGRTRTGGSHSWFARACDLGADAAAVVDAVGGMALSGRADGVGTLVALAGCRGVQPIGAVATTAHILVEKPWLEEFDGRFFLNVPEAEHGVHGARRGRGPGRRAPFETVFLATPRHSAASIQRRLDAGLDVVLVGVWRHVAVLCPLGASGSVQNS